MLQLQNETPFRANIAVFPDPRGVETLYVTVRAAFRLVGAGLAVAEEQRPVQLADEYGGDPARSSLARAGEVHLAKPGTDVVLIGEAFAPRSRPASSVDVSISIGPVAKTVRVFGDRIWLTGASDRISSPEPFVRIPLVYERAFGGVLEARPRHEPDHARIPGTRRAWASRGYVARSPARALPNLEDPAHLIAHPDNRPAPAGFGFIAPSWKPRRLFAGTYDEAWQRKRAPFLPDDFDARYFHAAHPDLVCKRHLRGGETIEVHNANPSGAVRVRVPRCGIEAAVRIAGATSRPPLALETVLVEPSERLVSLLFRGAVGCDKRALDVERVEITVKRLDLGARAA